MQAERGLALFFLGAPRRTYLEVEGRGGVEDDLDAGDLHNLVESALLCDVGDDDRLQLVLAQTGVGLVDLLGLVLGADSGHHRVAPREKCLEDVSC